MENLQTEGSLSLDEIQNGGSKQSAFDLRSVEKDSKGKA